MKPVGTIVVRANWLTRKPNRLAAPATFASASLICLATLFYLDHLGRSDLWMPASNEAVFAHHEYWRAWSALFAHSDPGHLFSNLFLFVPLAYWLTGYFGLRFFPILGFLFGGLVNLAVLKTMPSTTQLIGVSGVVYWMGAAWLTLSLLIDRRHSLKRRFASALFLFLVLFAPETYSPQVSYLSHLYGFLIGVPCALILYFLRRHEFANAEIQELVLDAESDVIPESTTEL